MSNQETTINIVCAWCGREMGTKPGEGIEGTSHGICEDCARKRTPERTDFLAGILVTAVEGGIDYWADVQGYHVAGILKDLLRDARTQVRDRAESDEWKHLTLDIIALGISRIKEPGFKINETLRASILLGDVENDAGHIDSEGADVIVQAGLLGEIVYA